ncbi:hypothetical protein EVAR_27089_1 [Eumeta japonica]|uniref:Uncharacterized protein n=1 Tax=Eumeta variegata TaxID=151549 RepID=A0A4C1VKH4_EUMVA|nr:hypothetical protein EVAR_27089_1 [Eumeta japonica]
MCPARPGRHSFRLVYGRRLASFALYCGGFEAAPTAVVKGSYVFGTRITFDITPAAVGRRERGGGPARAAIMRRVTPAVATHRFHELIEKLLFISRPRRVFRLSRRRRAGSPAGPARPRALAPAGAARAAGGGPTKRVRNEKAITKRN